MPSLNLMTSPQPPRLFSPLIRAQAQASNVVVSSLSFSQPQFPRFNLLCPPGRILRRLHLSAFNIPDEKGSEALVQGLQVPEAWLAPSKAHAESTWLRSALHKWLDDEYCPEPTNFEISRLAAQSYYESLISKETDLGEILLKMARRLETISFQQSFHGPYSSANAAVLLITQRMDSTTEW